MTSSSEISHSSDSLLDSETTKCILSAGSQNAVQRCSVENQKGTIPIIFKYSDSALPVLNGTF